MSVLRKCFMWYLMLTKRLFKKWSFIILLCLIPILIPLTNMVMNNEDSGVLHIVLYNEDGGDASEKVIKALVEKDSIVKFTKAESRDNAEKLVTSQKADAAWIILENFASNSKKISAGYSGDALIEILEIEENVPLRLSRELLFGAVYEDLSYHVYENFVTEKIVDESKAFPGEIKKVYNEQEKLGKIIRLRQLNGKKTEETKVNILTAPIRGILSLLILLCALAGAMYHLKDKEEGKLAWMPLQKRITVTFASCLAASMVSSIAVFATLVFCGLSVGISNEVLSMIMYVFAVTGFSATVCLLTNSQNKLGAIIPGIMIVSLVLSPVFFNFKVLRFVRLMLPSYYYLNAVYDSRYYLFMLLYIMAVFVIATVLNFLLSKRHGN